MSLQHIFLFGHRKNVGKDASVEILKDILKQKNISYTHSYFAKLLKKQVSEKYGLTFDMMCYEEYKNSRPKQLNGLSIRDVLIKEGCFARDIWQDVWAFPVYNELVSSNSTIGIISDFRYPNEYSCFDECFDIINKDIIKPKVTKILVYRPDGVFVKDGADDQLPDLDDYWDFTIINDDKTENWKKNIDKQLNVLLQSVVGV